MKRRDFLKKSTVAGLVLSTLPILGAEVSGRKYRTALVGCGWWGNNILGEAMASGACQITALCDVDQRQLDPTADRVQKETGDQPKRYRDFRVLLEEQKPDICIVATPD